MKTIFTSTLFALSIIVTLIGASKLIKTNLTEKSNKSWGCSSTGRA
jgi:hypothetical protein